MPSLLGRAATSVVLTKWVRQMPYVPIGTFGAPLGELDDRDRLGGIQAPCQLFVALALCR